MNTKKLIARLGGVHTVADTLKLPYMRVWQWQARNRVPPKYCVEIERQFSGAVTAEELRPDIFR